MESPKKNQPTFSDKKKDTGEENFFQDSLEYDLNTGLPIGQDEINFIPPKTIGQGEEIMGGAETNDFPDCCAVACSDEYECSGTLIASNLVLTANHCHAVNKVFIGGDDIDHPQSGEEIAVIDQRSHPFLDLKLLILERNSRFLYRRIATQKDIQNPATGVVAGFGTIDRNGSIGYGKKRKAEVPIMSLQCEGAEDAEKYGCKYGWEMVAGHRGLKIDTCRGDSGGPLYILSPSGHFVLLGATSRGTRNSEYTCGDGGIYIRVDLCKDWIEKEAGVKL